MSVQLIIDGLHITDVLAQVQQLASATNGDNSPPFDSSKQERVEVLSQEALEAHNDTAETAIKAPVEESAPTKSTKLSQREVALAVEEMKSSGEIDDRFELLSKRSQNTIMRHIEEKKESAPTETEENAPEEVEATETPVETTESAIDSMFDDAPEEKAEPTYTVDTLRDTMAKFGKTDKSMNAIRALIEKAVPKGQDIKVSNIPADALPALHKSIEALGA